MNAIEKIRSEIEKCLEALEAVKLFQLQIYSAREIEARKLTYEQCLGFIDKYAEQEPTSPCDLCKYNPPSSCDGKPCTMCPAEKGGE